MKMKHLTLALIFVSVYVLPSFTFIDPIMLQMQDEAGHEAKFSDQTSFEVASDGFIHIEFEISNDLMQNEVLNVNELNEENVDRLHILIENKTVKVDLLGNLSNSHVWHKVFTAMGITTFTYGAGQNEMQQPFDVFSDHFQLP